MYGGMALQAFFLRAVPAAGRGLQRARAGVANLVPRADDVPALAPLRCARRPLRAALVHGRRPDARRRRLPGDASAGRRRVLLHRAAAGAVVYSLGLAITVAPLTSTVLADADETDAGIASAINNAIARTAGLLATAAVGAVLASSYAAALDDAVAGQPLSADAAAQVAAARERVMAPVPAGVPAADREVVRRAVQDAGVETFHLSALIGAAMVAARRPARRAAAAQPSPPDRRRGVRRRPVQRRAGGARAARPGARARPRPGLTGRGP